MREPQTRVVEIFVDGACRGNPGPGGYGIILRYQGKTKEISGCHPKTTNNRMELTAVIKALESLRRPSRVKLFTDSNYVVKGMTEWLPGWIQRGWQNSKKKAVLNRDLWEKLAALAKKHRVEWIWVRGHAGHPENERCDKLARQAIRNCI